MAIQGTEQPAVIQIDESLRLRKFDGVFDFALKRKEPAFPILPGKQALRSASGSIICFREMVTFHLKNDP